MRVLLVWISVSVGVLAVFALLAGGAVAAYARMYENRMFPGVRIFGVRVEGLTRQEARKTVAEAVETNLNKGLRFRYKGREVSIDASTVPIDPDASRDLIRYDIDRAIDAAYGLGRGRGWKLDAMEEFRLRIASVNVTTGLAADRDKLEDALETAFAKELDAPRDARLVVDAERQPPSVAVEPERSGSVLVSGPALDQLARQAERLAFQPIELGDRIVTPKLKKSDVEALIPGAEEFLKRPGIVLAYETQKFSVPTSTLAGWISVTGTNGALTLTLDAAKFAVDVKTIASGLEKESKNGSFVFKDGKIESFTAGTEGISIDARATLDPILNNWPASSTFPLVVVKTQGTLIGADPERLGIKEIIGVGRSNFKGSPVNRRKNIARGVELVNGSFIQPGEIFSLLKTLGPIDAAHKWLPELVIKGNVTTPEFGGGLCQIGTTTFRAALSAGLPIIERQSHSYRVVYYEPAGTDATIYEPKPDFRFKNDTGYAIYINAYITGDDIIFEVWGTKDGRTMLYKGAKEVTDIRDLRPNIYNVTAPPPLKLVETLELAPGKKKCTEVAHAGADTDFTYVVTYPDGEKKTETFRSHYRPWQAVCLVGVKELTKPAETGDGASGSPDIPVVATGTTP